MQKILGHNFLYIKIALVFFVSVLLSACFLSQKYQLKKNEENYFRTETPPGCIELKENYFYDKTEVSNLAWLEYLYWTRRVFGADTLYKSLIPDSSAWVEKYPCVQILKEKYIHKKDTIIYYYYFPETYLRHPMYRDYPVVGVTQEQIKKYSKWRSDRVFEYTLIKYGLIQMNPDQTKDNYFSIENYFNGIYNGYKPDSIFKYYPCYRLPEIAEWKYALKYSDSVHHADCMNKSHRKLDDCLKNSKQFQSDINPCPNDTLYYSPTVPVFSYYGPIYNLRGNVSEWTSEEDVAIGGGWADTKERILANDTFHLSTRNAWTGFRNVCEWKKWKN